MKRGGGGTLPVARRPGLLVHKLQDEVVVYDLERHLGHCLNPPAALVWEACDGDTAPAAIAARVSQKLGQSVDEEFVWFALRRLENARLLHAPLPKSSGARVSRRALAKRLGFVGILSVLLPTVISIVAPTAVQAAASTCTQVGCIFGGAAVLGCCCTNIATKRRCIVFGGGFNFCGGATC